MVRKLRVSLALQPVATRAVRQLARSPRASPTASCPCAREIWRDTDNQRSGMIPFAFEPGMGFERYTEWALDVPMYFVKRGDIYHDVAGASFRDLLAGTLPQLPGERATISDWANHLSTLFPEVRLKRYLEMRGADAGTASDAERAAGPLGRASLRSGALERGRGAGCGLDPGGAPGACATACPRARSPRPFRKGTVRDHRARHGSNRQGRPATARLPRCAGDTTKSHFVEPLHLSLIKPHARGGSCWRSITALGRFGRPGLRDGTALKPVPPQLYGSAASRRPSPMKLKASTTRITGTIGASSHG